MNRREAVAAIAGGALGAASAAGQRVARPTVCMYSGNMAKIPFAQLPEFVKDLGYDGVDLTVMPGGHLDPSKYMVEMDRAFQVFQGALLAVPMVTTAFTSPSQSYAYPVFYISAEFGAQFCRLGRFPAAETSDIPMTRALAMRNDLAQFAATGRQCRITPLLTNRAGAFPGRSIAETEAVLSGIDKASFGYCFDPSEAVLQAKAGEGWEAALEAALPRLRAVSVCDATPEKTCPMGEGAIDWKKFFGRLATARFSGPLSLRTGYATDNEVNAMTKDLAFVRARVEEAWPA